MTLKGIYEQYMMSIFTGNKVLQTYVATAIATTSLSPSLTALEMATLSAHEVNGQAAFSTLQPFNSNYSKTIRVNI